MSTKVIKDGNVTTTIMDLTNGVGGKSAEVKFTTRVKYKNETYLVLHTKMIKLF